MRKFLHLYALTLLLIIISSHGNASEADPVNDQDIAYFTAIKKAVLNDNKDWLVKGISFPIMSTVQGQRIEIKTEKDFLYHYDEIINTYVKNSIRNQNIDDLFKDWKGLMIGRGVIWFGLFGPPNSAGPLKYYIVAINNESPDDAYISPNVKSAEDTVKTIVNIQVDAVNKNSVGCCWLPWVDNKGPTSLMEKYYTHDFAETWKCAAIAGKNQPVWDGDFIIAAQNVASERLISLRPTKIDKNTALVNVNIENEGEGTKGVSHVQFSLQRENNAWRVDDIIYLDNIAYNKNHKTPHMYESQKEALQSYECK